MLNGMTGCVQALEPKPKRLQAAGQRQHTASGHPEDSGFRIQRGSSRQLRLRLEMLPAGQKRCEDVNETAVHSHDMTT